jgi:hypothetical protein
VILIEPEVFEDARGFFKSIEKTVRLRVTGGAGLIGSHGIRHILTSYPTYTRVFNEKAEHPQNT